MLSISKLLLFSVLLSLSSYYCFIPQGIYKDDLIRQQRQEIAAHGLRQISCDTNCSVVTETLQTPVRLTLLSSTGDLLVSQSGLGTNTGLVSRINPNTGETVDLITGLPAARTFNGFITGPNRLRPLRVNKRKNNSKDKYQKVWTLGISSGDTVPIENDEDPPQQEANINGPSSPLFTTVLRLTLRKDATFEYSQGGWNLTPDQHYEIAEGMTVTLENPQGELLDIRLLNLDNQVIRDPRTNVRPGTKFDQDQNWMRNNDKDDGKGEGVIYVVDTNRNKVDLLEQSSGRRKRILQLEVNEFGELPIAAIRVFGPGKFWLAIEGQFAVPGQSYIALVEKAPQFIDQKNKLEFTPFITGLYTALDIQIVGNNQRSINSEKIITELLPGTGSYYPDSATRIEFISGLSFATSCVYDPRVSQAYCTDLNNLADPASGRLTKISLSLTSQTV